MHSPSADSTFREAPEEGRLDSWKQIAAYLRRSERTVRRWHLIEGLPVHRHQHLARGSVWAYRHELDSWLERQCVRPETMARTAHAGESSRWWIWGPAFGVIIVLAMAGFALFRGQSLASAIVRPRPLLSVKGVEFGAAVSPDGRQLAFTWVGVDGLKPGIYVQRESGREPVPLVTLGAREPGVVFSPAWSPDGASVAFLHRTEDSSTWLCVVSASGGSVRRLALLLRSERLFVHNSHLAWTRDGRWILAPAEATGGGRRGIYTFSPADGSRKLLTAGVITAPTLSPDGRRLAFLRMRGLATIDHEEIAVQDLTAAWEADGPAQPLYWGAATTIGMAWVQSGRELVLCHAPKTATHSVLAGDLYRMAALPGARLEPMGLHGCFTVTSTRQSSAEHTRLIYGNTLNTKSELWLAPVSGASTPVRFAPSAGEDTVPSYSPDGRFVAFISNRSGTPEVWVSSRDGSNPRKLTEGAKVRSQPRWSPDGDKLLFAGAPLAGHRWDNAFFTVGVSSGETVRLPIDGDRGWDPLWSPDGQWIYYSSGSEVWRVRPDGTEAARVIERMEGSRPIQISPDGQRFYFTRPGTPATLWSVPIAGGKASLLQDGLATNTFFAGSRDLFYFLHSDHCLYATPFAGGEARRINCPPPSLPFNGPFVISPDGTEMIRSHLGIQEIDLVAVDIPNDVPVRAKVSPGSRKDAGKTDGEVLVDLGIQAEPPPR